MKIHGVLQFLLYAALSGWLPFAVIFGFHHASADHLEIGILNGVFSILSLFIRPYLCSLADRYQKHKALVQLLCLTSTFAGFGLLCLPYLEFNGAVKFSLYSAYAFILNMNKDVMVSLDNSIVMRDCVEKKSSFGVYRAWGALGMVVFGLINGYLNKVVDFLPYLLPSVMCFMILFMLKLLVVTHFLDERFPAEKSKMKTINLNEIDNVKKNLETSNSGQEPPNKRQMFKEVVRLFYHFPSLFQYTFLVCVVGLTTAFQWTLFNKFLEQIVGKDPRYISYSILLRFLGELPFFLLAKQLIKLLGPSLSLGISLAANSLRFAVFGFLMNRENINWLLLVELLQGPAFGLFYCVMTEIAQKYALKRFPDQTQHLPKDATMQAIFGISFEGVGNGFGSVIGGIIVQKLDYRWAWIIGSAIAGSTFLLNIFVDFCKRKRQTR